MSVIKTDIPELKLLSRGKVRDMYELDEKSVLIVTTDRMSAFDVILEDPIPNKGIILNQLTLFWMKRFESLVPNHIIESDVNNYPEFLQKYKEQLEGRSVIAKKAKPLAVECVVRGYLAGSGYKDYLKTGMVCGHKLPEGLKNSSRFAEPLFTPSTKAEIGDHDENISIEQAAKIIGAELCEKVKNLSIEIYNKGRDYAASRGIIIADTKFEFGMVDGVLTLIDEVLTPDSSRFWPADSYEEGKNQASFDKQYLRDWLEMQDWDKTPPAPRLPEDVAETTTQKYQKIAEILTK
ncbi:phosphoribosylaminoimidazolesuccinocarboxamide synthase [Taurinivorans muris]|uniref:Phosphoribosylaminoimidazole-succinocarboxamide synthase n=1 Tax=Taurinivorans muris TaxID=2787751 RepID=A0ABY5Y1A5_9BACT|nr:phosphoribosylaminoimidazolesuccinocarboxamide synthase [Desulfovibrionaceae bacterium LT0009]